MINIEQAKKFSPGLWIGAILCFFLPFVNISCQDQRIASFNGIQLVTGTTVNIPSGDIYSQGTQAQNVPGEPLAFLILLCPAAGLFLSLFRKGKLISFSGFVGATGIILLYALTNKLERDLYRQTGGLVKINYGFGFWLAFILFCSAVTIFAIEFTRKNKEG